MASNESVTHKLADPKNSTAGLLLVRVTKGVVSLVANLFPQSARKEGHRVERVSRLREISQTATIGTLYGLLFAGLILLPLQPHVNAATAAPQTSNYEGRLSRSLNGLLASIAGGLVVAAILVGSAYVLTKMNGTTWAMVIILTIPRAAEGNYGDSETGSAEFLITSGTTENVDMMYAFESVATWTTRGGKLSEGTRRPKYDPEAYFDLSDMSYGRKSPGADEDYGVWTYMHRTMPVTHSVEISATTPCQYKEIDVTPKNTRVDNWEMGFNKSTLTWKSMPTTWKKFLAASPIRP